MNYNATAGARHRKSSQKSSLGRKKRVVDSSVMGAPPPPPANYYQPPPYNPYDQYNQPQGGMPPNMGAPYSNQPPPPYQPEYPPQGGFAIPGQLLAEPMVADAAMRYGQALVGSGRQLVDRELEKYVPVSRLKYYFAVDTRYVTKKLGLLFFPFTHSDWSLKYEQDEPVQPRYEINAPDLYIPTMAFVTYILVAGLVLGVQDRFSPEVLSIQASSALAWTVVEILAELVTLYITNIQTKLKMLDLLAFGGYKFVGIIFAVLLSLVFHKTGYYLGLVYFSFSLSFFLLRTLKVHVLPEASVERHDPYSGGSSAGGKRRFYFLLFIAAVQPVMMWWLSYHLTFAPHVPVPPAAA
ncbi:protein YIF1B-A isoform X3 [Bacillus rossius redtenbacheri]|uniref:protein YIF1B-A isoform X3 n=1 Tax=Bacillus rossius redtenbacheri TaxID=93214 RepID=UPI002FDE6970